ncbi:MAG: AAA family ATPase [Nanoarchaeota archaeon]|nr:AAA family ATPase [Nanoarchaeota archaeon]
MKTITLDQYIPEEQKKVQEVIRDTAPVRTPKGRFFDRDNLYLLTTKAFSRDTRNTPAQIQTLDVYERALAIFRTAAKELRTDMTIVNLEEKLASYQQTRREQGQPIEDAETQRQQTAINEAIFFSNRYALAFAGYVGLTLLGKEPVDIQSMHTFGTLNTSKDRDKHTEQLAAAAYSDITRIVEEYKTRRELPQDEQLQETFQCIFTSWIKQFNWESYRELTKTNSLEDLTVTYGQYSIHKGTFKQKSTKVEVDEKFMPNRREEIEGKPALETIVWRNLIKLGAYNHERQANPLNPRSVIFSYGEPGGGKTFISHACIQSFADLCKEKNIPLLALTHSVTDYASHFQNQTANALGELAKKIREFPGMVLMYVADADTIFVSRNDPQITQEQKQTLSVYFGMFDGTRIPKNGKFLAIMDANYVDGIDDATKSRLFDEIVEVKRFTEPQQFANLARRKIMKGINVELLTTPEWQAVGEYLLSSQLSNREIDNILKGAVGGFDVPEDILGKTWDEQVTYRNEQLRTIINKDQLITTFEDYKKVRAKIEEESLRKRFEDSRMRFLQDLATEQQPTAGTTGGA